MFKPRPFPLFLARRRACSFVREQNLGPSSDEPMVVIVADEVSNIDYMVDEFDGRKYGMGTLLVTSPDPSLKRRDSTFLGSRWEESDGLSYSTVHVSWLVPADTDDDDNERIAAQDEAYESILSEGYQATWESGSYLLRSDEIPRIGRCVVIGSTLTPPTCIDPA